MRNKYFKDYLKNASPGDSLSFLVREQIGYILESEKKYDEALKIIEEMLSDRQFNLFDEKIENELL